MVGKIYCGAEKVISWLGDDLAFAKVFKEALGRLEENKTVDDISTKDLPPGVLNTFLSTHILLLRTALNYLNTSNYSVLDANLDSPGGDFRSGSGWSIYLLKSATLLVPGLLLLSHTAPWQNRAVFHYKRLGRLASS